LLLFSSDVDTFCEPVTFDAIAKYDMCCGNYVSVCLSVTFVDCVKIVKCQSFWGCSSHVVTICQNSFVHKHTQEKHFLIYVYVNSLNCIQFCSGCSFWNTVKTNLLSLY